MCGSALESGFGGTLLKSYFCVSMRASALEGPWHRVGLEIGGTVQVGG